jgi:hypothetical protein
LNNKVNKARNAFIGLCNVWSSGIYKTKTKIKLFNAIVKLNLLYGCEAWALTKKQEKKLRTFQQRCLRRILRVFYPNLVSNKENRSMRLGDRHHRQEMVLNRPCGQKACPTSDPAGL